MLQRSFILDGLECLEGLKKLNLAGNHIDNVEEFHKLKKLDNLQHLILNDPKANCSNAICNNLKDYKHEIRKILPKLEFIDGKILLKKSLKRINFK